MPHSARAILSRSSVVRTECQSTTGRRRSMEKKSSSGTGAVGGSCAGSWQCIRSARESPNASANGSRVLISGRPMPRSQRLTALSVTCSFAASSACVSPRLRRTCARNAFASMLSHPFPQDSTNLWKTQPTERLLALYNQKGRAPLREHVLLLCTVQRVTRSDYSWGPAETRALPCSLPSYFLKFLMKRLARSLAFSSHWEASA